jgi:small subunit ribosomal protein S6
MRNYELVVVLDGKTTPAKKKAFIEKLEKLVDSAKGKLGKAKDWGVKDLAYKIKKSTTGAYLIFPLELNADSVMNISEKMRLDGEIVRYLLVRKEESASA